MFPGVAARVRVIRNGTEIKPYVKDENYDFNYQSPILIAEPFEVLPVRKFSPTKVQYKKNCYRKFLQGDDLILECDYDSSKRDEATYGGFSTREEMCLAMIEYFPRRPNNTIDSCVSIPDPSILMEIFGKRDDDLVRC